METRSFHIDPKELVPGLFFVAIGAFFLVNAVFFIGFAGDNGAGSATLPTLVSAILIAFGLGLAVRSFRSAGQGFRLLAWPKLLCVLVSPVVFGLTVRSLGFAPALVLSLFCASLADPATSWPRRAGIIAAVTLLCVVVFHFGLRLPFPLVQGLNLP